MRSASAPPWHTTGIVPTPAEWVAWFMANNEAGRLEIAEWSIRFSEEANDCLIRHGRR